jgi:hypothetical protein
MVGAAKLLGENILRILWKDSHMLKDDKKVFLVYDKNCNKNKIFPKGFSSRFLYIAYYFIAKNYFNTT